MNLFEELSALAPGRVLRNAPLASRTTLKVGGPADYLVDINTEPELQATMRYVREQALAWYVLGDGSNILISDKGIRGVVICLGGEFLGIEVDETVITVGSAARMSRVADVAASHSLSGLEGVGTVPGTVGGAIVMNAGTHRGYIGSVIREVRVVREDGELLTLDRAGCGFSYRSSRFQKDRSLIISSCVLDLSPGNGEDIREELRNVRTHRSNSQPQGASAGCFFKNPEGGSAGKLIEESGGKGLRIGGAVVSDIHANFIMNAGGATASDLKELAETVRELVRRRQGLELEFEVRLVGEW
jgi:UDP-N-acetylmuramate dehydrogenase